MVITTYRGNGFELDLISIAFDSSKRCVCAYADYDGTMTYTSLLDGYPDADGCTEKEVDAYTAPLI